MDNIAKEVAQQNFNVSLNGDGQYCQGGRTSELQRKFELC